MQEKNSFDQGKTIAVFDDDRDLLDIFSFALEDKGYKVTVFNDCKDIISRVRELRPALILMDNWIPDVGGEKAIEYLKSEEDLKDIPIILVSATNNLEEVAKRANVDAAVVKPFDLEVLTDTVAKLVR